MQAQRVMLETDAQGSIIGLPTLPPHTQVEVIFLFDPPHAPSVRKRHPAPELAGKMLLAGDLLSPVCMTEEWDVLQ